jgi:hypothetical protein
VAWIGPDGQAVHFGPVRRLVMFLLGVAVIIDALTAPQNVIGELVVGMVLIGLVPIDEYIGVLNTRRRARPAPGSDPGTTYGGSRG